MKKYENKVWAQFYYEVLPSFLVLTIFTTVALISFRAFLWGTPSFNFLFWNIFLALIPLMISSALLLQQRKKIIHKIVFITGLLLWLLFIPNAPYLITDIIHLGEIKMVPVLFDTFLLFNTALLGVSVFCLSLSQMEKIISQKMSQRKTSIFISVIILLISFGMYLGRFARFNSWDFFTNHQSLIGHIWKVVNKAEPQAFLYTLLFFLFLFLTYQSWKYLRKNEYIKK